LTETPHANPLPLLPGPRGTIPGGPALRNLYDFSPDGLVEELKSQGLPIFRAKQILHWLYKDLATDFQTMTNLPLDLRRRLAEHYRIGSAELVTQQVSSAGDTRKILLRFPDGQTVEAVLMLYYDRATVCVSSQVGCAMGCVFCATGQMGFTRNLSPGEMVEQVLVFSRWLRQHPYTPPALPAAPLRPLGAVTNVVFMGMGEPFLNYDHLLQAIQTLNSPDGLVLGARRMTVSTVGVVPRIRRFTHADLPVNLAISLHAPNDALRSRLVPLNDKYPLAELLAACREYIEVTKRRLTFEYALIAGENDSLECAAQLGQLLKGMMAHVNLIPLNPVPGTGLAATPREQVRAFAETVGRAGVPCTVRIERGQDIAAACGQLKVAHEPHSRQRSLNPELVAKTAPLVFSIPAHDI